MVALVWFIGQDEEPEPPNEVVSTMATSLLDDASLIVKAAI